MVVGSMNKVTTELPKPWLSIIIPMYNAEKFLSKCLDSLLEQTFTDYEVLLVDDGSTDATPDICQKYLQNDSRFRYIRKENGGAYQSRIYGAERAFGTYITFCDADDFYAGKNALARLHEETVQSNCSAIQFGFIKKYNHLSRKGVNVNTAIDVDRNSFLSQEYPYLLCSSWKESHLTPTVWNKIYHRSLLSNLPDSESAERVFFGEDQILNLQLLSTCESFRFIPDVLYCYRELSGGTNRFSLRTMKDLDNIKKYQLLYLERYQGNSKDHIKRFLFSEVAGWFFVYVRQALNNLNESELIALINETLQYPRFMLAREFFLSNPEENWEAANLLRKADAHEYIAKAKEYCNKRKMKDHIRDILKKIYAII